MKVDKFEDKEYWTVTEPSDLDGWTLMGIEDYKPGVKRLHVRRPVKFPRVPVNPWQGKYTDPIPGEGDEFRVLYCPEGLITHVPPSGAD